MPSFDGLNLTWETLEGLVKHNGPLLGRRRSPSKPVSRADPRLLRRAGPRAPELCRRSRHKLRRSPTTSPITTTTSTTATAPGYSPSTSLPRCRSPAAFSRRFARPIPASIARVSSTSSIRRLITAMIDDVIAETGRRLAALDPKAPTTCGAAKHAVVAFSPPMQQELDAHQGLSA